MSWNAVSPHLMRGQWGLLLASFALIGLFSVGLLRASQIAHQAAIEDVEQALTSEVESAHSVLNQWSKSHHDWLKFVAAQPEFSRQTEALTKSLSGAGSVQLSRLLQLQAVATETSELSIVTSLGRVLATTSGVPMGEVLPVFHQRRNAFTRAMLGATLSFPLRPVTGFTPSDKPASTSDYYLYSVTPIRTDENEIFAVLVERLNLASVLQPTIASGRFGNTGALLAVTLRGHVVAQTGLTPPQTVSGSDDWKRSAVPSAVDKVETDLAGYSNRFGRQVMGAWQWNEALSVGFVAEIEVAEAFSSYHRAQWLTRSFGVALFIVVLLANIAFRLHRQQALSVFNEERAQLEGKYQERTTALEEASQAKTDFLAKMSHEIRTPLTGVMGMLGLVMKTSLDDRQQKKLEIAQQSAKNLMLILNDVLDLSKIEAGKVQLEPIVFSTTALLESVVQSFAFPVYEKKLELILDTSEVEIDRVIGDPTRLRQILVNLVSNAVKFTPRGHIVVSVKTALVDNKTQLHCSVADTGRGIADDFQEHLFDRFTQAEISTTREFGGTGLGLSICRQLCELMNGAISVDSTPGVGSTFSFYVSLSTVPDRLDEELPPKKRAISAVLVVEPNAALRTVLVQHAKSLGILADAYSSVRQALESLRLGRIKTDYDLLLTGEIAEKVAHFAELKALMSKPQFRQCRCVVVRHLGDNNANERFERLGNVSFISRPVLPTEVSRLFHEVTQPQEVPEVNQDTLQATPSFQSGSHILLVEDTYVNQEVLNDMLTGAGLTLDIVDNGQIAVETLLKAEQTQTRYALIIMDCNMDVMDGYEATLMIRSGKAGTRHKDIPIIGLSADGTVTNRERCIGIGMSDFVEKPFLPNDIFNALSRWLPINAISDGAPELGAAEQTIVSERIADLVLPNQLDVLSIESNPVSIFKTRAQFLKVLQAFCRQYEEFTDDVMSAFDDEDLLTLEKLFHKMKGSSVSVGFQSLYQRSSELEHLANSKNLTRQQVAEYVDLVLSALNECQAVLKLNSISQV